MHGKCTDRDRRQHEPERHQCEQAPDDDFEPGQFSAGALGERAFECGGVEAGVGHHGEALQRALRMGDAVTDEGGRIVHGGQYRPGAIRVG